MANGKRGNGSGVSITIQFDADDPQDARALMMSQRLATAKHGRRRQVIIALLDAMEQHYQQTGVVLSPVQIAALIAGGQVTAAPTAAPQPTRLDAPPALKTRAVDADERARELARATVASGGGWFD